MRKQIRTIVRYGKPLDMRTLDRGVAWRKEIAEDQRKLAEELHGHRNRLDSCPICKNINTSNYVIIFGYPYDQCESCGHIYCVTPPKQSAVENLYNSDSVSKSVQSKIYLDDSLFLKRVEAIARPKVGFVLDVMRTLNEEKSGKWFDIGCGAGEVLFAAADAGWDVTGIESDQDECNYARSKGLKVYNDYLSEDSSTRLLQDAQVISLFNVLEHIPDPRGFLAMVSRDLDLGIVVFEVPRHPSLSSLSAELFPEMACRHIYPPDHLHIFSENSVNALLSDTGFEIVGKWYFGQDFFDLICSAGANQGLGSNSVWAEIACVAPKIQQVIDEAGLGDTVIIVAYKDKK